MPKFTIQGKGQVSLSDKDFLAEGGEGKVYLKGSTAFKIYEDPKKMIPYEKIMELSKLDRPNILRPKEVLLNSRKEQAGFTMDHISDSFPLCKLFTNDFRNANQITPDDILELVENIMDVTQFIHDQKILIVDGNDLNYLVTHKDVTIPYLIDVNSYQTPNFPATAIMPNIRDWTNDKFSTLTDWFSFAIISCQLFIGIHPFKGKHPSYKKNSLIDRIKDGVSVFNKDVRIPASTRDFSHIPTAFMEWYIKVFEKGERIPPPQIAGLLNVIQVQFETIEGSNNFEIKLIVEKQIKILKYVYHMGNEHFSDSKDCEIIYSDMYNVPIIATTDKGKLVLTDLNKKSTINGLDLFAKALVYVDNKLFILSNDKFMQIDFLESGNDIIPFVNKANNHTIMPNSTVPFDGCLYSNLLGKPYLMIPQGPKTLMSLKYIKELEKYKVIDAKYENNVCMVLGFKDGQYDKFILTFDDDKYSCRIIDDVLVNDAINFTVLKNGIVINILEDGVLEIFKNKVGHNQVKVIKDPIISNNMKLCSDGLNVKFFKGTKLYSLKVK